MEIVHIVVVAEGALLIVCLILLFCAWRSIRAKQSALDHYYRIERDHIRTMLQLTKKRQTWADEQPETPAEQPPVSN